MLRPLDSPSITARPQVLKVVGVPKIQESGRTAKQQIHYLTTAYALDRREFSQMGEVLKN